MRLPSPDDPELQALTDRYVSWSLEGPCGLRYMKLVGLNALRREEPARSMLMRSLAQDAHQITDYELGVLLSSEWRARLTAAWLIALDRRTQFRDQLGDLLRNSAVVRAGAGYCFALARFGQPEDADLLAAALTHHLPALDRFADRHFVIGALVYLDAKLGTAHAGRFAPPDVPWRQPVPTVEDRERYRGYIEQLCAFADECMPHDDPSC